MKKIMIILTALFTMAIQTNAMTYDQAREHALFLTDKMAYELNLTDDQYEAAYEINLDYLMSIGSHDDLYGRYWTQRNLDLSYILFDWQYNLYVAASYFYRPLIWSNGFWRFTVYSHYPHRNYLYFGRPSFYSVYRGGHSWRTNNGKSWYQGRTWGGPSSNGQNRVGMRDSYNNGTFRSGNSTNRTNGNSRNTNTNTSSQRSGSNSNVNHQNGQYGNRTNSTNHNSNRNGTRQSTTTTNSNRNSGTVGNQSNSNRSNTTVGNRTNSGSSTSSKNFGGRGSSTRTTVNQNHSTNSNTSSNSSIGNQPSGTFTPKTNSSSKSSSLSSGSKSNGSGKSSGSKGSSGGKSSGSRK